MNPGLLGLPGNYEIPFKTPSWGDLDQNLISYWNLQEATGARIDSKGNNHFYPKNTGAGNVTQGNGINGKCATFSQNGFLCENNATQYFGTGAFTIAGWFKLTSFKSGVTDGIFTKGSPAGGTRIWGLQRQTSNGLLQFEISSTSSVVVADTLICTNAGTIALNTWYFYVCWYDGSTLNVQVNNGGSTDSKAHTTGSYPGPNTVEMCLGGYNDSNTYDIFGSVDRTGIWSRVLTTAERTFLYNAGLGQLYPTS